MSAESQNCEARRGPLLGNGSVNAPIAKQWLSIRHVIAATDTHTTIEELLEAMISARSVPRLYNEHQLLLRESPETAVGRVRGWCEMAASLRGREPGSREMSTVRRRYQAT
jgi:hypothetical protein